MTALDDPYQALRCVQAVACAGAAVGSLEWLRLGAQFEPRGFHHRPSGAARGRHLLTAVLVLRFALAAWLAARVPTGVAGACALLALFAVSQALSLRLRYGLEGADQMISLTLGALALRALAPDDPMVARACLWFVALQAALAYLTAGVAKAHLAPWRDGSHVAGVLRTRAYGHPVLARVLGTPRVARLLSVLLIAWESTFPLALLSPALAATYCAIGVVFHLGNAGLMGLNLFVWAFLATYPAVLHCAGEVARFLGR